MARIQSAGDGHYLYLQSQFGEDRCTQFQVIVVTDPHTPTHRQDQLQYTVPQLVHGVTRQEDEDICMHNILMLALGIKESVQCALCHKRHCLSYILSLLC